jgi:hypothetical protein
MILGLGSAPSILKLLWLGQQLWFKFELEFLS